MKLSGKINFDRIPDHIGTGSLKWNRYADQDIIPMWVLDMDFPAPLPVLRVLKERMEHGIFGYAVPDAAGIQAVVDWMQFRHQWTIQPEWIVWLPGLVCGLNIVCWAAFSKRPLQRFPTDPNSALPDLSV